MSKFIYQQGGIVEVFSQPVQQKDLEQPIQPLLMQSTAMPIVNSFDAHMQMRSAKLQERAQYSREKQQVFQNELAKLNYDLNLQRLELSKEQMVIQKTQFDQAHQLDKLNYAMRATEQSLIINDKIGSALPIDSQAVDDAMTNIVKENGLDLENPSDLVTANSMLVGTKEFRKAVANKTQYDNIMARVATIPTSAIKTDEFGDFMNDLQEAVTTGGDLISFGVRLESVIDYGLIAEQTELDQEVLKAEAAYNQARARDLSSKADLTEAERIYMQPFKDAVIKASEEGDTEELKKAIENHNEAAGIYSKLNSKNNTTTPTKWATEQAQRQAFIDKNSDTFKDWTKIEILDYVQNGTVPKRFDGSSSMGGNYNPDTKAYQVDYGDNTYSTTSNTMTSFLEEGFDMFYSYGASMNRYSDDFMYFDKAMSSGDPSYAQKFTDKDDNESWGFPEKGYKVAYNIPGELRGVNFELSVGKNGVITNLPVELIQQIVEGGANTKGIFKLLKDVNVDLEGESGMSIYDFIKSQEGVYLGGENGVYNISSIINDYISEYGSGQAVTTSSPSFNTTAQSVDPTLESDAKGVLGDSIVSSVVGENNDGKYKAPPEKVNEILHNMMAVDNHVGGHLETLIEDGIITSDYRNKNINSNAGGSKGSTHMSGNTIDIGFNGGESFYKYLMIGEGNDALSGLRESLKSASKILLEYKSYAELRSILKKMNPNGTAQINEASDNELFGMIKTLFADKGIEIQEYRKSTVRSPHLHVEFPNTYNASDYGGSNLNNTSPTPAPPIEGLGE